MALKGQILIRQNATQNLTKIDELLEDIQILTGRYRYSLEIGLLKEYKEPFSSARVTDYLSHTLNRN